MEPPPTIVLLDPKQLKAETTTPVPAITVTLSSALSLPSCKACVNRPEYTENVQGAALHVVRNDHLVCNFCGVVVVDKGEYAALLDSAKKSLGGKAKWGA